MAIAYAQSPSLTNFMNQLDTIKSQGDYNLPMKLPPPTIPNPISGGPVSPSDGLGGALGTFDPTRHPVASQGGSDTLTRLLAAIRKQESGGNYSARNSMYGASGAYQILPSNFTQSGSGWDMEALGHDVSLQQFMNSPQIQDAIATYKLSQYLKQYGSPAAAAVAWYGGPGAVSHMYDKSSQAGGYPSLYAYWQSVLSKM